MRKLSLRLRDLWPFLLFAVFVIAFALGAWQGEIKGQKRERSRADADFSRLVRENVDVNRRLVQAELMIAAQKARRPSTQD